MVEQEVKKKYEVRGILKERVFDGEQQFLVRWAGNYKPSWQPAAIITVDCPLLVQEFCEAPVLTRILKWTLAPSSSELSWATIRELLGMATVQSKWKPPQKPRIEPAAKKLPSFSVLKSHWRFVDEMNDEAGKLPVLSILLVDALELYQGEKSGLVIIPQARVLPGQEYKTDYAVVVLQTAGVKPLMLFELKNQVTPTLSTVSGKHLAQTFVEGYYALIGSEPQVQSVVVALTNINVTHLFKVRLPTTRDKDQDQQRSMEVVWYYSVQLANYPPEREEELAPLMDIIHAVIAEDSQL